MADSKSYADRQAWSANQEAAPEKEEEVEQEGEVDYQPEQPIAATLPVAEPVRNQAEHSKSARAKTAPYAAGRAPLRPIVEPRSAPLKPTPPLPIKPIKAPTKAQLLKQQKEEVLNVASNSAVTSVITQDAADELPMFEPGSFYHKLTQIPFAPIQHVGSREEVAAGIAYMTRGKLRRHQLNMKATSRKASERAKLLGRFKRKDGTLTKKQKKVMAKKEKILAEARIIEEEQRLAKEALLEQEDVLI